MKFASLLWVILSISCVLSSSVVWATGDFENEISSNFLVEENYFPYKPHGNLAPETRVSKTVVQVFKEELLGFDVAYYPDRDFYAGEAPELFKEDQWFKLLTGTKIQRVNIGPDEIWKFPIGTTFTHCLYFAETPERLMQCRLEKLTEEGWVYAIYSPKRGFSKLYLTIYPDDQSLTFDFEHPTKGDLLIKMKALSPRDCISCHTAENFTATHFKDRGSGPCGFTPQKINLNSSWINEYTQKFGSSPFISYLE